MSVCVCVCVASPSYFLNVHVAASYAQALKAEEAFDSRDSEDSISPAPKRTKVNVTSSTSTGHHTRMT